jgi:hypothetical protein
MTSASAAWARTSDPSLVDRDTQRGCAINVKRQALEQLLANRRCPRVAAHVTIVTTPERRFASSGADRQAFGPNMVPPRPTAREFQDEVVGDRFTAFGLGNPATWSPPWWRRS